MEGIPDAEIGRVILWSDDEHVVLAEIRRAGGFQSDTDAIRGALWWYARHLALDVPADVFRLSRRRSRRPRRSTVVDQKSR